MKKNKLQTRFKDARYSLGFLIWKTSNKLQRLHRIGLENLDLTPTQFSVLASIVYVSSNHEKLTQSLLCQHTEMDKMLVSDIIKSLVKKEFINKRKNTEDTRSFLIQPTSLGVKVANKAIKIIEDIDKEFFRSVRDISLFGEDLSRILAD